MDRGKQEGGDSRDSRQTRKGELKGIDGRVPERLRQAGKGISSLINIKKSLPCVSEQVKHLASYQLEVDKGNSTLIVS